MNVLIVVGIVGAWLVFGRRGASPSPGTPTSGAFIAEGIASFYGGPSNTFYEGRPTASGEIFNSNSMTAAMRTPMPLGTRVKVTDLSNGKSVVVKINDRGPFHRGGDGSYDRIIDLSAGAARVIDLDIQRGLAQVRLEKVG